MQIKRSRGRRLAAAALAAVLLAAALLLFRGGAEPALGQIIDETDELPRPNVVLIMTDDQSLSTVLPEIMPKTFERIIDPGTSFSDYIVTTPLCCPSRATTITGQYGHNNGVLRNDYDLLKGKQNTLPVWLQRAGYTTAHIGKYMNAYERSAETPETVAPGWDLWFTQLEKRKYYDWKASKNGTKVKYKDDDDDHLTEVTNRRAANWTRKMVAEPEPFYLQLDYYAPHGGLGRDDRCKGAPVPGPADEGVFDGLQAPRVPSFNEVNVSDKPEFIQERELMDTATIAQTDLRYRCAAEALRTVDSGIGKVYRRIERAGELDETIFIFSSDNGYFFGEHRIPKGKKHPYEENVHMPLSILIPPDFRNGAPVPKTIDTAVANIDLAPTIVDLTGIEPCRSETSCRTMDGRSLLPILDGSGGFPTGRDFLIELFDCSYRGVRGDKQFYLEHGEGPLQTNGGCKPTDIEHYDLADDPFQLGNLYPASRRSPDGELQLALQEKMATLGDCAGVEGRDPEPQSGVYCE